MQGGVPNLKIDQKVKGEEIKGVGGSLQRRCCDPHSVVLRKWLCVWVSGGEGEEGVVMVENNLREN